MDHDIIEKKPLSPIASSLLVVAGACTLLAMVFAAWEIRELKGAANTPNDNARSLARGVESSPRITAWRAAVDEAIEAHNLEKDNDEDG